MKRNSNIAVKTRLAPLLFVLAVTLGIFAFSAQGTQASVIGTAVELVTGSMASILNEVLYQIVKLLAWVLAGIGSLLSVVIQPGPIISSSFVQMGFAITRDFANMFFILILLGIALDLILFNSYQVKRMLPRLLIIALLINFCLPIAGLVIDFANVFTSYFLAAVTNGFDFSGAIANKIGLSGILSTVYSVSDVSLTDVVAVQNNIFLQLCFAVIFILGTIFIFCAMALMFLIRTGYLYVLLTILPVVLVLSAFPPTSSHFNRWSHKFIQWTMFAPVATFFLYLSLRFFNTNLEAGLTASAGFNSVPVVQTIYSFITIWMLMLGSLMVAQQMGISGAGAAMNVFSRVGRGVKSRAANFGKDAAAAAARKTQATGEKGWLNKAAEFASQSRVLSTLGVGRVLATAGATGQMAIEKQEQASAAKDRALFEGLGASGRASMARDLNRVVGLPGSNARLARLNAIQAEKGELNVRNPDGTVAIGKTQTNVEGALKNANTYDKKSSEIIGAYHNPENLKITQQKWEKDVADGKAAPVPVMREETVDTGITTLSREATEEIANMTEEDKRNKLAEINKQEAMSSGNMAKAVESILMADVAREMKNMDLAKLTKAIQPIAQRRGLTPQDFQQFYSETEMRDMVRKEKEAGVGLQLKTMTTATMEEKVNEAARQNIKSIPLADLDATIKEKMSERVMKKEMVQAENEDGTAKVDLRNVKTGKLRSDEIRHMEESLTQKQVDNAKGSWDAETMKILMRNTAVDTALLRKLSEAGDVEALKEANGYLRQLVTLDQREEFREMYKSQNRSAYNDFRSGAASRFVQMPEWLLSEKGLKRQNEGSESEWYGESGSASSATTTAPSAPPPPSPPPSPPPAAAPPGNP